MASFLSHIKKELGENLLDYLTLFTASVFFLILLRYFRGEKTKSFVILMSFVFFYIAWGVYHHFREKTLRLKTVIEYILIGFIALFILTIAFLI